MLIRKLLLKNIPLHKKTIHISLWQSGLFRYYIKQATNNKGQFASYDIMMSIAFLIS